MTCNMCLHTHEHGWVTSLVRLFSLQFKFYFFLNYSGADIKKKLVLLVYWCCQINENFYFFLKIYWYLPIVPVRSLRQEDHLNPGEFGLSLGDKVSLHLLNKQNNRQKLCTQKILMSTVYYITKTSKLNSSNTIHFCFYWWFSKSQLYVLRLDKFHL